MLDWLFGKRRERRRVEEWRKRMQKLQSCSVYLKGSQLFVMSSGRKEWMPGEFKTVGARPLLKVDRADDAENVGNAILTALNAFKEPVIEREVDEKELYKFIGVKSWAQTCRETKQISVTGQDDESTVSLTGVDRYIGEKRVGGDFTPREPVKCPREPEELGRRALEFLDSIPEPRGARKGKQERVVKVKSNWRGGLAWLAVKTEDVQAVVNALIKQGIKAAIATEETPNPSGTVGVYSPEPGWTLAIGGGVLPDAQSDGFVAFLKAVSIPLGELYYFANYRIVEHHAWAKVVNGEIVRAFAHTGESGEISLDEGPLTPEEEALGPEALEFPDDEMVFHLAQKWSVDPAIVLESVS